MAVTGAPRRREVRAAPPARSRPAPHTARGSRGSRRFGLGGSGVSAGARREAAALPRCAAAVRRSCGTAVRVSKSNCSHPPPPFFFFLNFCQALSSARCPRCARGTCPAASPQLLPPLLTHTRPSFQRRSLSADVKAGVQARSYVKE